MISVQRNDKGRVLGELGLMTTYLDNGFTVHTEGLGDRADGFTTDVINPEGQNLALLVTNGLDATLALHNKLIARYE